MKLFFRFLQLGSLLLLCLSSNALHYRSIKSGYWSDASVWECAPDPNFNSIQIPDSPPDCNSNQIIIRSTHTVILNGNWCLDELTIESDAVLSSAAAGTVFWNVKNGAGTDLTVNGTLEDHCPFASQWESGARWILSENATIVRSRSTAASGWKEHYENGIAQIPISSNWILRKNSTDHPSLTTASMVYGNLRFENHTAMIWDATSGGSKFSGWTNFPPHIKGNLFIGDSVRAGITAYCETPSLLRIDGDLHIAPACSLVLNAHSNHSGATGLEIGRHLYLSGEIISIKTEANDNNRKILLNGTSIQEIHCYVPQTYWNIELENNASLFGTLIAENFLSLFDARMNVEHGLLFIDSEKPSGLQFSDGAFLLDENSTHEIHVRWKVKEPGHYRIRFGKSASDIYSEMLFDKTDNTAGALGVYSASTNRENTCTNELPCLPGIPDDLNFWSDRYWKIEIENNINGFLDLHAAEDETPFENDYSIYRIAPAFMKQHSYTPVESGWYGVVSESSLPINSADSLNVFQNEEPRSFDVFDLLGRKIPANAMQEGVIYLKVFLDGSVEKFTPSP